MIAPERDTDVRFDYVPGDFFMLGAASVALLTFYDNARLRVLAERMAGRLRSFWLVAPLVAFGRWLGGRDILASSLVLAVAALWMSRPLWGGIWFEGHEYGRYLSRTIEFVRGWREGSVYPRWAPDFYGGFGSPFFDFFPPGVFAAAGPLALAGLSIPTALKIAMLGFTLLGGLGALALVRGETERTDAGLVAGAAFVFMPYRFVDLFLRGDLAEYAAISLLPWAFFFYREISRAPREQLPGRVFLASLTHAGVLLTHTIIGQWATEALALAVLLPALGHFWRGEHFRALSPVLAMGGAFCLAAVYLLPALGEKEFCSFERVMGGYYTTTDHLVPAADFFNLSYYAFVGDLLQRAVRMPFSIGTPLVLAMVLAAACLLFRGTRRAVLPSIPWWLGTAAVLWLMTPAARGAYRFLPLAGYLQFPWRLLGLSSALGAAALGTTWAAFTCGGALRRWRWPLALVAVALVAFEARRFEGVKRYYVLAELPDSAEAVAQRVEGTTSAHEHLPRAVVALPLRPRDSLVKPAEGPVRATAEQLDGTSYRLSISAEGPGSVDVQIFHFAGWRARTLSGPAEAAFAPSPRGLTRLAVPGAGEYVVQLSFGSTPIRKAGATISLLALLFLLPALRLLARLQPDSRRSSASPGEASPIAARARRLRAPPA